MSYSYNVKAIPTTYNHQRFRSRLESRYAAFFDILNWSWSYEPLDYNNWIPDFSLPGAPGKSDLFLEIKPITEFSPETATKIVTASDGAVPILLLGLSPVQVDGYCHMGWAYLPKTSEWVDCYLSKRGENYSVGEFSASACPWKDAEEKWRIASNWTQWRGSESRI